MASPDVYTCETLAIELTWTAVERDKYAYYGMLFCSLNPLCTGALFLFSSYNKYIRYVFIYICILYIYIYMVPPMWKVFKTTIWGKVPKYH